MLKLVTLSLFLASTSVFAQQCPAIKWSNAGVMHAALEMKREELLSVKYLMVDMKKMYVGYVLDGEQVTKKFAFKTCGEVIDFGPTM